MGPSLSLQAGRGICSGAAGTPSPRLRGGDWGEGQARSPPSETKSMNTFVRCGNLFTGAEDEAQKGGALVFDGEGQLLYVGAEAGAPRRAEGDRLIDHSGCFVMPGLIDVHTHLAYGNAKSEEDIDLYSPLEFRALRGLFFAQKVAAAGYTAICSPGDAEQISLSIRDAIRAGLFDGPRVMAAGPYLTTHP